MRIFVLYFEVFLAQPNVDLNGVFSKWSRTVTEFNEFSEFRESEESLKHELGSV